MPTLDFKNAVIKKTIANIKANKGISFKSQLTNTSNYLSTQSDFAELQRAQCVLLQTVERADYYQGQFVGIK